MKKNILGIIGICFLFLSCENELLEIQEEQGLSLSSSSLSSKSNSQSDCVPDLEALELSLPDVVTGTVTAKPGVDSYFTLDILDTDLAGTDIAAWCVDQDLSLYEGDSPEFIVYSTYEELPEGEFEFPENFDLVNWVINQDYIGKASTSGGNYTFAHIQYAIWLLVDDSVCIECTALSESGADSWTSNAAVNIAMAQEIAAAAIANGEGFVPGCGQKVGVILNPAGKQAIMIVVDVPEKEEECKPCEGKVTELELQYNGDVQADIIVKTKGKGKNKVGDDVFIGTVNPGETFSFVGKDDKGTLGTEISIYVNGSLDQKIHTSCSVPIGPGAIFGDYTVISGKSREGGELCDTNYSEEEEDDNCDCDGKLTELDLAYSGDGATIIVETKGKSGSEIFNEYVDNGGTIELVGNDKKGTLGTEIKIYINGSESVKIHTSCSDPNVVPGYKVGDFEVIRGASRNNGELCPVDVPPNTGGH
ncbi:hypothetical protein GCM10023314_04430 [Algibacter agarivorans]|uniref:DUF7467 domain-containing protein n=1 Tax=Algibacter agarivorans TaxID=1109741 RepID=A0ABP9GAB9_9FLAO